MSEHWYTKAGDPFYRCIGANGAERDVTLRDARRIGACPSVTTILAILAKPALTTWMVRQGILAALTLPRNGGEDEASWIGRIESDSRAQAQEAAQEGSRIHDAIEKSFLGEWIPAEYVEHVSATRAEIAKIFPGVSDWFAEKSFAHRQGFGGKVDLHSPSTGICIDYKGKDGDFTDGKKLAYDQHYQLAAYQYGLNLPVNVCCNVFVSRTHPGKVASHIWTIDEVSDGLGIFLDTLSLWKRMRRYDPTTLPIAA